MRFGDWRSRPPARAAGSALAPELDLPRPHALGRAYARLGGLATALSDRPARVLGGLLALNLGLAALLTPIGYLGTGDRALYFRELMPGTWLSFGELVLVSGIAWEAHRRAVGGDGRVGLRRFDDFWALSAVVFAVLALDEISQATLFLSHWTTTALDVSAPAPFRDVDGVLLLTLLAACAMVVARRAVALLRHRRALALLGVAALLGGASQAIDSFVPSSEWETVVEDSLKLASVPFFVGGYLAALRDLVGRPG